MAISVMKLSGTTSNSTGWYFKPCARASCSMREMWACQSSPCTDVVVVGIGSGTRGVGEEMPHGIPDVLGTAHAVRADAVVIARHVDEQPADLAVRCRAGQRCNFQEAAVVAVGRHFFQRGLRLRLIGREVLAVGGVEQIDVVLARTVALVDDLPHLAQPGGGHRAAGAGHLEELFLFELPGFRG